MSTIEAEITNLISTYHEINGDNIEELQEEPSALEFMRYVSRNRPFVARGGAMQWPALLKWNSKYLSEVMTGQSVSVAMTPLGNADSVLEFSDGVSIFVTPYEREVDFDEALRYISNTGLISDDDGPVCYCQTQNDNLRNEYESLFKDVPKSVPFARIALERDPDAINFWLGNSHSVTALHRDPYENIYVQVLGQKHFVLLPPVESACINERMHPSATYQPLGTEEEASLSAIRLHPVLDERASSIPFAIWDPDIPEKNMTPFSYLSKPMKVTLNPGDILYLPALWYHKVSQSCSDEGICCAVNYWYDMEYSGSFYPLSTFSRRIGLMAAESDALHEEVSRDDDDSDDDNDDTCPDLR